MRGRKRYSGLVVFLVLVAAIPACNCTASSQDPVATVFVTKKAASRPTATKITSLPTDTPTRRPTREPKPTDIPTIAQAPLEPTEVLSEDPSVELKEELYYGGCGGSLVIDCMYYRPSEATAMPTVTIITERSPDWFDGWYDDGAALCLFDFPTNEIITVNLTSPRYDSYQAHFWFEDGTTMMQTYLWFPIGLPTGQWKVEASSASVFAASSFMIEIPQQEINTMPSRDISPFEGTCDSYSAGERVIIRGTNFEPNAELPLGVYYLTERSESEYGCSEDRLATLVSSETVTTDSQGAFSTSILVESTDPAGWYCIATANWGWNRVSSTCGGPCFTVTDP
jgi:hypothetical protein